MPWAFRAKFSYDVSLANSKAPGVCFVLVFSLYPVTDFGRKRTRYTWFWQKPILKYSTCRPRPVTQQYTGVPGVNRTHWWWFCSPQFQLATPSGFEVNDIPKPCILRTKWYHVFIRVMACFNTAYCLGEEAMCSWNALSRAVKSLWYRPVPSWTVFMY